jgi:hypothetical protein
MSNGEEAEARQHLAEVASELKDIKSMQDGLVTALRDFQTELHKFYDTFTEATGRRIAHLEQNQKALITRLDILETRVDELERQVSFPKVRPN